MDPLSLVRMLSHGTLCFAHEDIVVYVDPYELPGDPHDADVIIITHAHADHYSPADLNKARKEDTCFITTASLSRKLQSTFGIDDIYISEVSFETPGLYLECGVGVTPVAAVNAFHPVESGFGFVLQMGGFTYYVSGHTDVLAEDIKCDVLFICCDGVHNMPCFETSVPAALRTMDRLPGLVVPYHYGEPGMTENGAKLCTALTALDIPCQEWKD